MKTPQFKRFTKPDVLCEIGTELLAELFDRFKQELAARSITIPSPNLAQGHYYESVAEIFKSPAALPDNLVDAVLAVEELADPENKSRLERAFWDSPQEIYIEPQSSPEHTALKLWLNSPYERLKAESGPQAVPVPAVTPAQPPPIPQSAIGTPGSIATPPPIPQCAVVVSSPAVPSPVLQSAVADSQPDAALVSTASNRTRNGKVARLPKAVRNRLNHMMLDGLTYRQIIEALGEDGQSLNEDNLTTWKTGGYLDWRREEMDLAEIRVRQEYALELARETEGTSLCEATSKMLVAQIMDGLRGAGPNSLQTALADKPEIYVRLLNSVARLSTAAISCEQQRLREEARKASLAKEKSDPADRSITQETLTNIDQMLRNH